MQMCATQFRKWLIENQVTEKFATPVELAQELGVVEFLKPGQVLNYLDSEKLPLPILANDKPWEVSGVSDGSVIEDNGTLKMVYMNSDASGFGFATSTDGLNWVKENNNPFFTDANTANNWAKDDIAYPSFDWFFLYSFCKKYKLYRSMERLGYYRVFANVSLQNSTKVAFIRDRMMFRDFVAKNTKVGAAIKYLFFNEQNNTILNEEYTDYEGKAASEYFEPSETKVRRLRGGIYKLIIQGYWHTKSLVWLILG